jgi:hypothetical protein
LMSSSRPLIAHPLVKHGIQNHPCYSARFYIRNWINILFNNALWAAQSSD